MQMVFANGTDIYKSYGTIVNPTRILGDGSTTSFASVKMSDDGQFIVAGGGGTNIFTSSDGGANWTEQTGSGIGTWNALGMSADGSLIVAGALGASIYTSTDFGVTWTERVSSGARNWLSIIVADNGSRIVASTTDDNVYYSTDQGANWTAATGLTPPPYYFMYGSPDAMTLTINEGNLSPNWFMSTDGGATWSTPSALPNGSLIYGVTNNGQRLVASDLTVVGAGPVFDGHIYVSDDDGASWTSTGEVIPDFVGIIMSFADDGSYGIMFGADSTFTALKLFESYDSGETWDSIILPEITGGASVDFDIKSNVTASSTCTMGTWELQSMPASLSMESVAYGNGIFVAGGGDGPPWLMSSPDGKNWTVRTSPIVISPNDIAFGNGIFVGVDNNTQVVRSTDGINWTAHTVPQGNQWRGVAYGNGVFVAVSADGTSRVMTSPDGITWTVRNAAQANFWNGVEFGNGMFVAVSADGTNRVMTSPNGITWTAQTITADSWYDVAFGNGIFVAVSDGGAVATSPDGITWTDRTAPNEAWQYVTFGNGRFVAVAWSGANRTMTSTDGINWTAITAPQLSVWDHVTYGNGTFVAVANDGTNRVMTASCLGSCTNPSEPAGSILYNNDRRVMEWCDGKNWHAMGPDNPVGSSSGCGNPTGEAGEMVFNSPYRVAQYCNGDNWVAIGKPPASGTCSFDGAELLSHWKLDESGGTVATSANNGQTGTLINGPTWAPTSGRIDGGLQFDGNNDRLAVGDNVYDNLNAMTACAWFYRTAVAGTWAQLAVKTSNGTNGWNLYTHNGNGRWGFQARNLRYEDEWVTNPTNTWVHVCGATNGADTGDAIQLYKNGASVARTEACSGACTVQDDSAFDMTIGATHASTLPFGGIIDDVRIYNRVLTATEVAEIYQGCSLSTPCGGIGGVCVGGAVYAGLSPDGNSHMYTTAADGGQFDWNDGATNYTDVGAANYITGEANTAALITIDSNSVAGGVQPHAAAQYCSDLVAHGYNDWYLPSRDELNVIYQNRAAIGGFNLSGTDPIGYYWSSNQSGTNQVNARRQNFSTGVDDSEYKASNSSVRCVRK